MSRTKTAWTATPVSTARPRSARLLAAWVLRSASALLDRAAWALSPPATETARAELGSTEFYAQAGAPEGALYVDGQFVGYLDGVRRL